MLAMSQIYMFFLLLGAHYLCDYPLQGPFLYQAKNRNTPISGFPWWHAMGAHTFIHGCAVVMITHSVILGILEIIVHFITDTLKCDNRIDINEDQIIHILCKVIWLYLYVHGVVDYSYITATIP